MNILQHIYNTNFCGKLEPEFEDNFKHILSLKRDWNDFKCILERAVWLDKN